MKSRIFKFFHINPRPPNTQFHENTLYTSEGRIRQWVASRDRFVLGA